MVPGAIYEGEARFGIFDERRREVGCRFVAVRSSFRREGFIGWVDQTRAGREHFSRVMLKAQHEWEIIDKIEMKVEQIRKRYVAKYGSATPP